MEKKQRAFCRECSKFKRYYTKEYCSFAKAAEGYCLFHKKTVSVISSCEQWSDERVPPCSKKWMAKKQLENIRRNLTELRQILDEEDN